MTANKLDPLLPVPGRPIMVIVMAFCHLVALLALIPYFFSWAGVSLAVVGSILSALGINICYHRMLAHRGISCSKRVEHCLAVLGVLAYQFGPAYWVAIHRRHHQFSDDLRDPHRPGVSFFWSHIGWLFAASDNTDPQPIMERYAKDILKDPFYVWLENKGTWGWFAPIIWAVYFAVGALAAILMGDTATEAVQFGSSLVVWGAAVRIVFVWHITFSVNSVCHCWGYRNHTTPDDSRNNPIIGLLAFGEGWHNNHHAFPQSPRHGQLWWELDLSWLVIRALAAAGFMRILYATAPERLSQDEPR
jgi:fatty-acid desaturase